MDNLFNLKQPYSRAKRTAKISMRIEPEIYNWIKAEKLSPTRIFDMAIFHLKRKKGLL